MTIGYPIDGFTDPFVQIDNTGAVNQNLNLYGLTSRNRPLPVSDCVKLDILDGRLGEV